MQREILTYPMTVELLHNELSFVVGYFAERGHVTCNVVFGYAWGLEYYPDNEWDGEDIVLSDLESKINEVEVRGIGHFGKDDLFIEFPGLRFLFCNDSDIHIYFTESNPHVEFFYSRWRQLGYKPAESKKNNDHGPGKRVRSN
jgi:hypothetical protein